MRKFRVFVLALCSLLLALRLPAANFDPASAQYIDVGSGVWTTAGPITWMFWNKAPIPSVARGWGGSYLPDAADRVSAHPPYSGGTWYWDYGRVASGGRLSASYSAYANLWTHVTMTSAGSGGAHQEIFFNAASVASQTTSDGPQQFPITWQIGHVYLFSEMYAEAKISDVRLYERVLNDAEISATVYGLNQIPATNGQWLLIEASGTNLTHPDVSAAGHTGTGQNGVAGTTDQPNVTWHSFGGN